MIDVKKLNGIELRGWQLGEAIGQGADGIVYSAKKQDKTAAVKIFFPDALERNGVEEGIQRLDVQLQLIGEKQHPNLVEIYEGGELEEYSTIYIAMELVEGQSLDKLVDKIPTNSVSRLISQLASAAQFLESKGLVHRDIKPANIVISSDYRNATLLDLGIIFKHLADNDGRLSGEEFIATTRYSPPEFVWRTEDATDQSAWQAITFYQIGATLHDMIMGCSIFSGSDKPLAKLYDSVRLKPPTLVNTEIPKWIVDLAKCCLVKNWRERLHLVNWDAFKEPAEFKNSAERTAQLIRMRQVRAREEQEHKEYSTLVDLGIQKKSRTNELWDLQENVFLEVRQFLIDSSIFPRFRSNQNSDGERKYFFEFIFEKDNSRLFEEEITITISLSINDDQELATDLKVIALDSQGKELSSSSWIEMLDIEKTVNIVQQSLLQVVDGIVPNN